MVQYNMKTTHYKIKNRLTTASLFSEAVEELEDIMDEMSN